MEIRRYRNKTSSIRTPDQFENYFDLELFFSFNEFNNHTHPIPFQETAITQSSTSCLFRENEIFPLHVLSNKDEFVSVDLESFKCVPVDLENIPPQVELGAYYFRERRTGINNSEAVGFTRGSLFESRRPLTSIQKMFGRGIHRGRSVTSIRRIARYWQFVKFVENAYLDPSKFVRTPSRVPAFETIFPSLSFDLYKDRGLMEHYPFLHSRRIDKHVSEILREKGFGEKQRVAVKEAVIEQVVGYIEGLKESYLSDIILPFSNIPGEIGNQILTFIHDECDDCFVTAKISEKGISLYRGIDSKLAPYFEEMFSNQDEQNVVSVLK